MERTPIDWEGIIWSMKRLSPEARHLVKDTLEAIKSGRVSTNDVCEAMNIVKEMSIKTALENKKALCDITQDKK